MIVEVKVPQLSESVAEATLVSWHKKAGEFVTRDENLVDIETDKVVLETPAPESGVLLKIIKGNGSSVGSKELIAQIDTDAKPTAAPAAAKAPASTAATAKAEARSAAVTMPAAEKHAVENNVDTAAISGSGRGGRVTKGDVLDAIKSGSEAPVKPAVAATPVVQRAAAPAQRSWWRWWRG